MVWTVEVTGVETFGTTLSLSGPDSSLTVHTAAVHPQLAQKLSEALATTGVEEAVSTWRAGADRFRVRLASGGDGPAIVVDDTDQVTGDHLVGWGRTLAGLLHPDRRTVLVCGSVTVEPDSDYDTLGALAASVIRFRVSLFVGVGSEAKALATQVGMEGSWDGESQWAPGVDQAYDYLCANLLPGDFVVLLGLDQHSVSILLDRWGVVDR